MRLVRPLVPVPRVLRIAFPTMQVSMNPSSLLAGCVILGNVMRAIEVSPGIPPQSLEQGR